MKKVKRSDIVDYQTYSNQREAHRRRAWEEKASRRIHLGHYLTFLFENKITIIYQIQEMIRAERITRDVDIQHQIDTYNELLGESGEIGCTLLIEIDNPEKREEKLSHWLDLPKHVYLETKKNKKSYARFDPRQVGERRLSAVQYLKFKVDEKTLVALGCDFPSLRGRVELDIQQRQALEKDLR